MGKFSNTKRGFTLVEVLVSVGIMVIFLPFAANMLTNSRLLASYAKHKIQAAYAAQQIIETQRQQPISYFAPYLATVKPVTTQIIEAVLLDTKGNYINYNCATNPNLFCGTATITVTPAVYTPNGGGQPIKFNYTATYQPPVGSAYTYYTMATVGVQINWVEQIFNIKVAMTENYTTNIIVNDQMLN